jgi:hypothetical protein
VNCGPGAIVRARSLQPSFARCGCSSIHPCVCPSADRPPFRPHSSCGLTPNILFNRLAGGWSSNRLLKNGDWLGAARQILGETMCRDVPVPIFQHAAKSDRRSAARAESTGDRRLTSRGECHGSARQSQTRATTHTSPSSGSFRSASLDRWDFKLAATEKRHPYSLQHYVGAGQAARASRATRNASGPPQMYGWLCFSMPHSSVASFLRPCHPFDVSGACPPMP